MDSFPLEHCILIVIKIGTECCLAEQRSIYISSHPGHHACHNLTKQGPFTDDTLLMDPTRILGASKISNGTLGHDPRRRRLCGYPRPIRLLSGTLGEFLRYSCQEAWKWLLSHAHGICDPADLPGKMLHNTYLYIEAQWCSSGYPSLPTIPHQTPPPMNITWRNKL